VLLKIWGNTERQDAAYDISLIKITKPVPNCPREFVIKKCNTGGYWTDCPETALDGNYEQCCSPLLSLQGATDKGDWPGPLGSELPEIDYAQISKTTPLTAHYLHPNLTSECPKATTVGSAVYPEIGTCDVEPTYWSNCPDTGGGYVTPLAAWRNVSPLRSACPAQSSSSSGESGSAESSSSPPPPAHFLADETDVRIYSIFYVVDPVVVASMEELAAVGGAADTLYEVGGQGYFYINDQYEPVEDYDNTKVGWYARVTVSYELLWFEEYEGDMIFWGPVDRKTIRYMAKLTCDSNGKPIGAIPPPPAESSSSSPSQPYAFTCGGELDNPIPPVGYALKEEFPTLFLYRPGTAPTPPSEDGEKVPSTPGPEWCGGTKTSGDSCATLGVECPGCEKLTECPAREIVATACISGTDEDLGCEMGLAESCRTFVLPPGDYQVHFEADTMDGLYHVQMEHNFLVNWVNEEDGPLTCPPTPPVEPMYLFNKASWADIVPEPFKTYLDEAADRWALQITFNKAIAVAIEGLYASIGKQWAGIELSDLYLETENVNRIAACGINQAVDVITTTSSVKFNATEFLLLINQAYATTNNPSGCALTPSQWVDVLTHELGHAIGIGIFWQLEFAEMGAIAPNAFFLSGIGYPNAQEGYNVITNLSRPQIPLEDAGGAGTASAHWENTFRPANYPEAFGLSYPGLVNELMIGSINTCDPTAQLTISALSVGVAVDFGYDRVGPPDAEGVPQITTTLPLLTAGEDHCTHFDCRLPTTTEIVGTIYMINPPIN
jgi:hypothetical protein